jgi:organic hydroperoxide reductase OsmC/OhrA
MGRIAKYHTTVEWKGAHRGRLRMGNGPEMDFSAPPDAYGEAGVLTPEDAFMASVNTCIMMMFVWTAERFKIELLSYDCYAEGTKVVELDRTETFSDLVLRPKIAVRRHDEEDTARRRVLRALESARKYSLIANSVKSTITVEPEIVVL